jgi:hypothetical protein
MLMDLPNLSTRKLPPDTLPRELSTKYIDFNLLPKKRLNLLLLCLLITRAK